MFNLDLSKIFPIRAYNYIAPLFPGLFFEISVLLANPRIAKGFVASSEEALWSGHYLTIFVALFLAFAVGFGGTIFVSLLVWLLSYLRGFGAIVWRNLCGHFFMAWLNYIFQRNATWRTRPWLQGLNRYVAGHAFPASEEFREIQRCWKILARELLQQRYGLEEGEVQRLQDDDWRVLYWTLAVPTREELSESISMIASHAAGWCGFAAAHFAPMLRNRWYLGFSSLLILSGLLYDYYDARRRVTPEGRGYMNIRALLREFSNKPQRRPDTGDLHSPQD